MYRRKFFLPSTLSPAVTLAFHNVGTTALCHAWAPQKEAVQTQGPAASAGIPNPHTARGQQNRGCEAGGHGRESLPRAKERPSGVKGETQGAGTAHFIPQGHSAGATGAESVSASLLALVQRGRSGSSRAGERLGSFEFTRA